MAKYRTGKRFKNGQKIEISLTDNQYAVASELALAHGMPVEEYLVQMIKDGYQYYRNGEIVLSKAIKEGLLEPGTFGWLYKLYSSLCSHGDHNDKEFITSLRRAYSMLRGEDKDEWVRVLKSIRDNCVSEALDTYTDISLDGRHTYLGHITQKNKNFLAQGTLNCETMNFNKGEKENDEN